MKEKVSKMKAKLIRKEKLNNKEVLVFKNTMKPRLPMAPAGFAFKNRKDKKKINKVTIDNWDKI